MGGRGNDGFISTGNKDVAAVAVNSRTISLRARGAELITAPRKLSIKSITSHAVMRRR